MDQVSSRELLSRSRLARSERATDWAASFSLIPYWGPTELIPKRSKGPRVTSNIGKVEGLKALDLKPPIEKSPPAAPHSVGRARATLQVWRELTDVGSQMVAATGEGTKPAPCLCGHGRHGPCNPRVRDRIPVAVPRWNEMGRLLCQQAPHRLVSLLACDRSRAPTTGCYGCPVRMEAV